MIDQIDDPCAERLGLDKLEIRLARPVEDALFHVPRRAGRLGGDNRRSGRAASEKE